MLGKETKLNKVLFRHEHPANMGGRGWDKLYQRNNDTWEKDKDLYMSRRNNLFGLGAK